MISSKQVLVSGGQFSQYNYNGQISLANRAPIDILTDAVAPSAFHDSGASFDKPKCHPRTRLKIREIIMRWIVGEDEDAQGGKPFMWLNGAAGCGKSAISQSIIESCIERDLPLASFFFSRTDSTRNHTGSLVATLAYQLYCAFPGTQGQTEILSAIQNDPLIFKKTLQRQITSLIIQPLKAHFLKDQTTQGRVPFVIVIDGLDECSDRTAQKAILTTLADSVRLSDFRIPIFIASRPERDIRLSFSSKHLKGVYTRLSLDLEDRDDTDSDIRLYFFDKFAEIKDDFNERTAGRKLVYDWPGDEIVERLVRKSSGQFIYAATVTRYVESTRHRPDHRLDVVLNLRPDNGDHPFAELDALYTMIFESVLNTEKVVHVLSLYFMDISISCSIIEELLSYDEGEVETLFCDMAALVQIYKPKDHFSRRDRMYDPEHSPSSLRILHASLGEYLLDAARSKQFHIDMDYHGIRHVNLVLQYLASCSSSSFKLYSNRVTPITVLASQYGRIGQVPIPLELRQTVLNFPLKEFLEPHTSDCHTYPGLLQYFVTPFLELLDAIAINDPTSSCMKDRQLEILRTLLMQQIQQYFNDDRLAAVLVLFYHLASHRFVPILQPLHIYHWHSTAFYLGYRDRDILSLSLIWSDSGLVFGDNIYHRYMRQLLHDPCPTAKYAVGPVMHARTVLACFKELARTVPLLTPAPQNNIDKVALATDDEEDDAYPNFLSVRGGEWQFEFEVWGPKLDDEGMHFLLLGYIIFLLPRCGRSDALVAACEEHDKMSYIEQPNGPFPVRRRLLRAEINDYKARASLPDYAGRSFGI
ncbi:hypothetical protein D9613_010119 [Agrocybe pediades]|uniref:Nephrocystin 3-like N-terminal domain-containing protein n=1 Tax=Agrocybe pediades TaxID=84607 RepID=A0A8H4QY21_9AGAR|nr:hypothetical protein D9613_010119 [Agrocybe pediades]